MTNINFLPMISVQCQETRLWELIKWSSKRKCFDLLSNSLNSFFKEIYRDQFGEFICGYWGLKGYRKFQHETLPYFFYGHNMQGDRLNHTVFKGMWIFSYMWQMYPSPPSGNWPKFSLLDQVPTPGLHKNPNPDHRPPTTPTGFILIHVVGLLLHKNWLFHASFIIRNNCFELFSSVHSLFQEIFSLNLTSPFCRNASVNSTYAQPPPRTTAGHLSALSVPGVGHLQMLHCPGAGHLPTPGPILSFFLSEYNYKEGFTGRKTDWLICQGQEQIVEGCNGMFSILHVCMHFSITYQARIT